MLSFDELKKKWNTLSNVQQFEILAYATALLEDNAQVPAQMHHVLQQRKDLYENEKQNLNAWQPIFNKLIDELI